MSLAPSALFVRHQALPGKRDEVRRIWEKFVQRRAEANPAHLAYYFCYDDGDPDVVCVFQLYTDVAAAEDFRNGACYSDCLAEVATVVAAPPLLTAASLVWAKPIVSGQEHRRKT
jgi:quinol monooxygenase YgiN